MKTATVITTIETVEGSVTHIRTDIHNVTGLDYISFHESCNLLESKLAQSQIEQIVLVLPKPRADLRTYAHITIDMEVKEMIRKFQAVAEDLAIPFVIS